MNMKHIPNILTTIRLLMIPLFFKCYYSSSPNNLRNAMIVYVVASFTDVLDGYIARKYDAQSTFGTVADPLADKLLQLSAIYALSDTGYLQKWFFYFFLAKELIQIIGGAILAVGKFEIVIPANKYGKITSVLVFLTIVLSAFNFPHIKYLEISVIIFGTLTFIQYVRIAFTTLKNN